jgi:hypothetical protein
MAKPKLSIKNTNCYTVFSDDETFEPTHGSFVVLVDGDCELGDDGSMKDLLREYDKSIPKDPMVSVKVGKVRVRAISVQVLLQHYLNTRSGK